VVDLSDARYLDSAGINVLFELAERLKVRQLVFAIVVPEDGLIERVFSLVDLGSVVDIQRSVDAAVHAIRAKSDGS
jgi:anti-anti-sigma factor